MACGGETGHISAGGSDGTDGRSRIARKVTPDCVISTADPEARHTRKSPENRRDGYRAHVAADPETGLITSEHRGPACADRAGRTPCGDQARPAQAPVAGGSTIDDFTADETAGTVTCPAGLTRPITARRYVTFGAACRGCPLRARCTTAKDGRALQLHPQDAILSAARATWAAQPSLRVIRASAGGSVRCAAAQCWRSARPR